jgi:hypothetical protein
VGASVRSAPRAQARRARRRGARVCVRVVRCAPVVSLAGAQQRGAAGAHAQQTASRQAYLSRVQNVRLGASVRTHQRRLRRPQLLLHFAPLRALRGGGPLGGGGALQREGARECGAVTRSDSLAQHAGLERVVLVVLLLLRRSGRALLLVAVGGLLLSRSRRRPRSHARGRGRGRLRDGSSSGAGEASGQSTRAACVSGRRVGERACEARHSRGAAQLRTHAQRTACPLPPGGRKAAPLRAAAARARSRGARPRAAAPQRSKARRAAPPARRRARTPARCAARASLLPRAVRYAPPAPRVRCLRGCGARQGRPPPAPPASTERVCAAACACGGARAGEEGAEGELCLLWLNYTHSSGDMTAKQSMNYNEQ